LIWEFIAVLSCPVDGAQLDSAAPRTTEPGRPFPVRSGHHGDEKGVSRRVSLVAIPEAMASTLSGLYDVFVTLPALEEMGAAPPEHERFEAEIVGESRGPLRSAGGIALEVHKAVHEVPRTDIVIVPSLLLPRAEWRAGRYPALVEWLRSVHERGAILCSACSGLFLLAETGAFDGADCTIHWGYANGFRAAFPRIRLHPERALVVAGARGELVSSGASTSWQDLALYLIARHAGVSVAQAAAKFFALQLHREGLAPYMVFTPRRDHADGVVTGAQDWLAVHFAEALAVEQAVKRSGLPERTFTRRFTAATGHAPLAYVQRLRIEDARRRLERTESPVDEIAWQVGYEEPAFFRRLFRRLTGLAPGAYRRKFQMPKP
jgi:transcriptional regulator GlxA family with amidase domain